MRLLTEKTKEVAEVAFAKAVEGRIVALGALLIVTAEKINESVLEFRDTVSGTKEKMSIYECVLQEALSLGSAATPTKTAKHSCSTESQNAKKRKLLLREIELLQLFGVVAQISCTDKKVTSPLIRAVQVSNVFLLLFFFREKCVIRSYRLKFTKKKKKKKEFIV